MEFTPDQLLARANELRRVADRIEALAKKQSAAGIETQELLPWLSVATPATRVPTDSGNASELDVIL